MKLTEVVVDALENGGGTYSVILGEDWSSLNREFGYFVSAPSGIENLPNEALSVAVLEAFVNQSLDSEGGFGYLGLWKDEAGRWSVDNTHWLNDRETAEYYGRLWNQRAIWDCNTEEAINL